MRRAAGLEVVRGLAPLVAVLRVLVRRVVVEADGGVAGEKVSTTEKVSPRAAVLTWATSGAWTGAAKARALALAFALLLAALLRDEVALALEEVELTGAELLADLAGAVLRLVRGLAAALVVVDLLRLGLVRLGLVRLGLVRPFGLSASPSPVRVRWAKTSAHSASLRLAGLAPWVWATLAAFSISATRFCQEAAKRLSDWDLAPLSIRVSITPSALTFLRRRWKISFCNWAIRASPFSLIWMVS
jgi:hypothetical protein